MSEWKEYELGEIYKVHNGLSKGREFFGSGFPFISFSTVFNKWFIPDDIKDLAQTTDTEQESYSIKAGDVLVTRTSETADELGMSCVALKDIPKATYNGFCKRMRQYNKDVDVYPKYVGYYMRNPEFRNRFLAFAGSMSTRASLTNEALLGLTIKLPPLAEQQRIAGILSSLDDKIELNNQINDNLEKQAQALFKNWFIDYAPFGGVMPEDWKVGKLGDFVEKTINGDWGKDEPSGTNTEEVFCIRGADIPEVKNGHKGKMPTRYILPKNYQQKKLEDGELVVEISGGSPTQSTGRVAYVSDSLLERYANRIVCTNFCRAIKAKESYSILLYYHWQNLYNKGIFFSYENGTTGIKNLDMSGILENEEIVIPSKKYLEKFNAYCSFIFKRIFANGMETEQLTILRDTLLPKLMSAEA